MRAERRLFSALVQTSTAHTRLEGLVLRCSCEPSGSIGYAMQPELLNDERRAAQLTPARVITQRSRLAHAPLADASDEQLVAQSRAGEQAAFGEIVQRHRTALLARCRRTLDADAAEDAVQLAFVSAWRALRDGCEVAHLRAWLLAIAQRSALQCLRARPEETDALPSSIASAENPGGAVRAAPAHPGHARGGRGAACGRARRAAARRGAGPQRPRYSPCARRQRGGCEAAVFRARAHLRDALPAPLAWPLFAGLASRWRARAAGTHLAGVGARSTPGVAPVLARAAAVVLAGAAVSAPIALQHAGGGSAQRGTPARAQAGGPVHALGAAGAVSAGMAQGAVTRSVYAVGEQAATSPTADGGVRLPGAGHAPSSAPPAAGAEATRSSAAAQGAHAPAASAGGRPSRAGSVQGAPVAGPGSSEASGGEALGGTRLGAGGIAGGVVQGVGKAASGAVSGVTHTAETVVDQAVGSVSAAAPVVGTTVQGSGATVTQTVNKTGEAVAGLVEHVTAPLSLPAHGAGPQTPLGGLLGR